MKSIHRLLLGASAVSVGAGIARSICAAAQPLSESTDSWIAFCIDAGEEAWSEVIANPPAVVTRSTNDPAMLALLRLGDASAAHDHERYNAPLTDNAGKYAREGREVRSSMEGAELRAAALIAASAAFAGCLPPLTSRARSKAYIACVAVGIQKGYFTGPEAKAMLHTAQLALSAHPKRTPTPRHTRRKSANA